jgi:hypothetical protein
MVIIKKIAASVLIFVPLTLTNLTCNYECIENTFLFNIEFKVTPTDDSLHMGDTLWIESIVATKMLDLKSNKEILFDHATNLTSSYRISELSFHNLGDAVHNFDFVLIAGSIIPNDNSVFNNRVKSFRYIEENDFYKLKFGMVCRKKGLYGIFNPPIGNVFSPRHGSCNRSAIQFKLNNNDRHIQYLQDTYYSGQIIAPIDTEVSYCFKVI